MFKIIAFFIITLLAQLYVWIQKTTLILPLFIEVPVPDRKVSGHVFCVRGIDFASTILRVSVMVIVFNATFNNISVITWRSALLVEETGGPGQNHHTVASNRQT